MRIFFLLIFFLCNTTYANTIFESNKLNNIDYLKKIKELENFDFSLYSKNRIFLMYAYDNILAGKKDNIQCNKFNPDINKINVLIHSLKKYDLDFLNKNNVNYIVLCENLKINNYLAAGFANSNVSTIILDFAIDKDMTERVIHHEIFHMIHSNYNTNFLNKSWSNKNNSNFTYKKCTNCGSEYSTELLDENQGFLTEYSKFSANEDQAEVFSFWMTNINTINIISKNDIILKNKVDILKKFLNEINFKKND
jgi:hypothetical protein